MSVEHLSESFCGDGRLMDFDDWVTRMRVPADTVDVLRDRFGNASPELRRLLSIEIEGDRIGFRLPQVTLLARKPA
jgi:hypothetical protein